MTTLNRLHAASAAVLFAAAMAAPTVGRADQVFNDDVIITGSLCVGFDCVNGESFGFDTIRLKENNTRIKFDDTSVSAGFPNHDWQLTANDSASGGANKFSIEDITAATVPFTVLGSAPSNSIFVASSGKVGFRTSAPVLDLHVRTGNTPGMRLEQDASGGFSPQTWDIGANEANFFVRDVTGGSRLPFRIRPGAPTSSIDISASGNVGFGTVSPGAKTEISLDTGSGTQMRLRDTGGSGSTFDFGTAGSGVGRGKIGIFAGTVEGVAKNAWQFMLDGSTGNVGIGTFSPSAQLHTTGSVRFAGVANCGGGLVTNAAGDLSCMVSSRRFKNIAGALPYHVALANVMALRPQQGAYKKTPKVPEHWLIAEDVAKIDPALAGFADGKPYTVKTQNVVADLVAVVQHQQRQIDELKQTLADNAKH